MKLQRSRLLAVALALALCAVASAEEVQWVRVTVLLESGPGLPQKYGESLIRGGIYSTHNEFSHNVIRNMGLSGITLIGHGPGKISDNHDNLISHNEISYTGEIWGSVAYSRLKTSISVNRSVWPLRGAARAGARRTARGDC